MLTINAENCIEISDLTFSYGNSLVLDKLSFSAGLGECVYILGPNGCGKTTLFRCLLGQLKPDSGTIGVWGRAPRDYSPAQLAERLAYIPQERAQGFNYSVLEMVLMGACPRLSAFARPDAEHERAAVASLERLGIAHLQDMGFNQISGGERQLALIARALMQNAQILIMDEPTASLDYGNQIRVQKQMRALAREGYLVIQSAHNPQHAMLFADRVAAMSQGKICALGAPESIINAELLEKLYGLRVSVRDGQLLPEI